jgi:transcriptional regulator NrdR family protein
MICPYRSSDSKVTNSRLQKRSNSVWRRRHCLNCGAIWTTVESMKGSITFKVLKDEDLVDFRPEILLISLYECLKHRKTPETDAQYIFETVVGNLQSLKEPIFSTNLIATTCHKVLKNYDKLSADLYKTLHPFTD